MTATAATTSWPWGAVLWSLATSLTFWVTTYPTLVLARGLVSQLDLAPIKDYVQYALTQPVSLVVIGCDTPEHVQELAAAAREFQPMPKEDQHRLEELISPFAKGLMYYKP